MREIMCQLQQGAKEGGKRKRRARKDVANYHGPYVDSSGEKFYLPRKWTLCPTTDGKTTQRRYKECGINYSFKPDEMKGGDLMRNLQWLGQFGRLRTLFEDDDEVDDNNDEDAEEQSDLTGGGGPQRKRCNDALYKFEEERNIRRAMPEMEGTLGNWTLHGQNLRTMLKNYNRQYRHLPPNHRRELGQFFNTTLTVLETIGSMAENAILQSVQFDGGHDGGLTGGGMDNAPQPKLPPTKYNLSRYVAFFPDYQLDNGNVLRTNDDVDDIFSTDYPPCPDGLKLRENPEIPNHDKAYSTDNNSSTKDSLSFSSSEDNEHDALNNDSDSKHGSYV